MAFVGSPFHHHLTALTTEYERIMAENKELRTELHKDPGCPLPPNLLPRAHIQTQCKCLGVACRILYVTFRQMTLSLRRSLSVLWHR